MGIVFLFFVARAERSLVVKGGEMMPAGITDVPGMLWDKVDEIKVGILGNNETSNSGGENGDLSDSEPVSTDSIIVGAKNLISNTIDKISETIKTPIENKVSEIFCPQK